MQSLLGEGIGAQGAHPLAHWHIGALPWGLKPAAFNGADPTAFGPPGDEAMGEFKRTAGQRAVRVACCVMRRSTPLKSIFYVRRARNRARSKGGEGRFFHRFIFLLLFVVSRSKVTPPIFLLREFSIFKTFDEILGIDEPPK